MKLESFLLRIGMKVYIFICLARWLKCIEFIRVSESLNVDAFPEEKHISRNVS